MIFGNLRSKIPKGASKLGDRKVVLLLFFLTGPWKLVPCRLLNKKIIYFLRIIRIRINLLLISKINS